MQLVLVPGSFAVCRLSKAVDTGRLTQPWFLAATGDEVSLVCRSEDVPVGTTATEDGWTLLKVDQALDFGLVGVIAQISQTLATAKVPVFVISTYLTDYVMVKTQRLPDATMALADAGLWRSPTRLASNDTCDVVAS